MEAWKKYITQLDADKEILNLYRKLREEFQKEGWSEEDLEKPPYYTPKIMGLFHAFQDEQERLRSEINSYFGNVDSSEFLVYIGDKLRQINDETPLNKKEGKYGNKKRRN